MDIEEFTRRSNAIRARYHELEVAQDGHSWTLEQDTLSFLTDAGLLGRNVMAHTGSWPKEDATPTLGYKLAECMWWLASISDQADVDLKAQLQEFLEEREKALN